jgi:hypothetical protein
VRMIQFRASVDEIRVIVEALKALTPFDPNDTTTAENMADYLENELRDQGPRIGDRFGEGRT